MQSNIEGANGTKICINSAPFLDVMALKNAIEKELASNGIKLDSGSVDLDKEIDLSAILKVIMQVDSSKDCFDAIFKCLSRCTYNMQKITVETFDADAAREDYYLIISECIKVNLTPFIKGLVSSVPRLLASLPKTPK